MRMTDVLQEDWRPALGCTEPASIAWTVANAAAQAVGPIERLRVVCDPRVFKNCFAVGLPNTGGKTGIEWAAALGASVDGLSAGLEIFHTVTPDAMEQARSILERKLLTVEVDESADDLLVDATVERRDGTGRAVVAEDHSRLVRLEHDGEEISVDIQTNGSGGAGAVRRTIADMSFHDLLGIAQNLTAEDRHALHRGGAMNLAICERGSDLLPERFMNVTGRDPLTRVGRLVSAGVYARMSGEDMVVMSLAGSGNKGITCTVPVTLWGLEIGRSREQIDEALALGVLVTCAATHYLGTLAALCGVSNAAGIGLAAAVVLLERGGPEEISLAVTNVIGNISGVICDGAKIGCALKAMTTVDAAFRCASLALAGMAIPVTDGIVGADGHASLTNLGRLSKGGGHGLDHHILAIMQEKLG